MSKNTVTPQLKYDTSENWGKAVNFVPAVGMIIVYTDTNPPKVKYGDGRTKVNDLGFIGESSVEGSKLIIN